MRQVKNKQTNTQNNNKNANLYERIVSTLRLYSLTDWMNYNIHQYLRDNFGQDSLQLCKDWEKFNIWLSAVAWRSPMRLDENLPKNKTRIEKPKKKKNKQKRSKNKISNDTFNSGQSISIWFCRKRTLGTVSQSFDPPDTLSDEVWLCYFNSTYFSI